ncbi:MAG: class I SAM-dependent methyltransferase [Myxococcales bacterium]|nr:class I SAM-dependent methyltransferase [Myxococcales bacterium]MCB9754290.1 class I SAM-dependent methyltransferase [Myxococcales bacterium]
MRLYSEFADWFHLLTAPEDYAEEAARYVEVMRARTRRPLRRVLELGAGGGNNALFMKREFTLTLTDVSPQMLSQSRRINPECEHVVGDMRSLRLEREFDAVFVHDAIMYATREEELRATLETAALHCAPGGVVVAVPDYVLETYAPFAAHGGHDDAHADRGLRYLEWVWMPEPESGVARVEFVLTLREGEDVRVEHESQRFGVFPRATWIRFFGELGLEVHEERGVSWTPGPNGPEPDCQVVFAGVRPETP